ncbi:MAG: glycosyltransferase family 2 protein [Patescibacteria group bacterium]
MDLSVIIVNYKTQKLTLQTLKSVFAAQTPAGKVEVILIDNHSQDDILIKAKAAFSHLITISNDKNLGFSAGNNLGLRQARGRYVLLLNSDTIIESDTLIKMVVFMDAHPRVGLATCRVELANGQLDLASHRGFPTPWAAFTYYLGFEKLFPRSRWFGQYHQGWQDLSLAHPIDAPVGAFFFLRKSALNQVGLLDEAFFMYAEDIDLAFRLKKAGWEVMYNPDTKITHLKGSSGITSISKDQRVVTTKNFFQAMKIFYQKHYAKKYFPPIKWLIFTGIDLVKLCKIITIKFS